MGESCAVAVAGVAGESCAVAVAGVSLRPFGAWLSLSVVVNGTTLRHPLGASVVSGLVQTVRSLGNRVCSRRRRKVGFHSRSSAVVVPSLSASEARESCSPVINALGVDAGGAAVEFAGHARSWDTLPLGAWT